MRPSNVRRWQAEELLSRKHGKHSISQGEMLWQTEVSLPAAMLVSTMRQLSTWGAVTGRRGALLHRFRDRATSHGELPQLARRSDFGYWCHFNFACTCCHPTGIRDRQLPAHARTAERYLVRRHLSAQRIASAGLSSCGCCSFACRFMGDSTTKKRCSPCGQALRQLDL
jgi:hypothetical protein